MEENNMKRFFILFILLLFAFNALAIDTYPGETVTVPIIINTEDAYFVGFTFSYNPNVFEFVSNNCVGPNTQFTKYKMIMYDIYAPIPSGEIGTITLRIKEDAETGEYEIPAALEAWTFDEEAAHVDVYIDTINIKETQQTRFQDFLQLLIELFWNGTNE